MDIVLVHLVFTWRGREGCVLAGYVLVSLGLRQEHRGRSFDVGFAFLLQHVDGSKGVVVPRPRRHQLLLLHEPLLSGSENSLLAPRLPNNIVDQRLLVVLPRSRLL